MLSQFLHLLAQDAEPGRELLDSEVLARRTAAAVYILYLAAAGVMSEDGGRLRSAAATGSPAVQMQVLQEHLQEGPCNEALLTGAVVIETDLRATVRWPQYRAAARQAGWSAVASVPVVGRGRVLAVLDLLRRDPGAFSGAQLALAETLSDVAACYLLMAEDRRAADRIRTELTRRALYDDLTRLPNRALLGDRLEHELAVARRTDAPLAVLFVDLDRFKDVNDTLGHGAGDELLVHVARQLLAATRAPDTVARIGGDEFVVVCPELPEPPSGRLTQDDVAALAQRLRAAVATPLVLSGEEVVVSASIGAVIAGPEHRTATELLRDADAAMYAIKRRRSPGRVVDLRDHTPDRDRLRTARQLRTAAQDGQLRVHYQPIAGLRGQTDRQVEALVRWQHPERGLLAPGYFLATAESAGLMVEIGREVLEQACAFAAGWHPGTDRSVAVNVSGTELAEPHFAGYVRQTLDRHGLDPRRLRLEVTENVLLDPGPTTGRTLIALRDEGIRISLDDFGTGFSSLSHLERFDVDTLKIDQVFVGRLGDQQGDGIVAGVLALARALDLDVVAEGVEHPAQRDQLAALGCDYAQGFLLGHPRSASAILSRGADSERDPAAH